MKSYTYTPAVIFSYSFGLFREEKKKKCLSLFWSCCSSNFQALIFLLFFLFGAFWKGYKVEKGYSKVLLWAWVFLIWFFWGVKFWILTRIFVYEIFISEMDQTIERSPNAHRGFRVQAPLVSLHNLLTFFSSVNLFD